MSHYRKKPVVIEARQFLKGNGVDLAGWCGGIYDTIEKPSDHSDVAHYIVIPTIEGNTTASIGDWIIRGVKGEFYPCKPDIFAATYELVK